jgi:hypothetical protein
MLLDIQIRLDNGMSMFGMKRFGVGEQSFKKI